MSLFVAALIGLLAGAHTATWGMYKDAIHEGFTYPKYLRSIVLGGLLGPVVGWMCEFDLASPSRVVVLFGVVYVVERGMLELYKTFLREEDQSKYFIPSQFHIRGRVVASRLVRWLVAGACLAAILPAVAGVRFLQDRYAGSSASWLVLAVGSLLGWVSALGGAWKDAPIEGFELLKFFRSPGIALLYAWLLSRFTESWVLVAMAAEGYTIATIETYKTFFFPGRPRGKFAGKPILYPEFLGRRKRFVPLYVGIWLAIIVTCALALAGC